MCFFSNAVSDETINAVAVTSEEGRNHLWEKTKGAFTYLFQHHFDDVRVIHILTKV